MKYVLILFVLSAILIVGFILYKKYTASKIVKNTEEITRQFAEQLRHDSFPIEGEFIWTFYLGPAKQVSIHRFFSEYIDYQMIGPVHSTEYRMHKLSYDSDRHKWIGETPEGIVYVMFFKNITDHKLTIYKHKGVDGLAEAIDMKNPSDNVTTDHGWNDYTRSGNHETPDTLPFSGEFQSKDNSQQLNVADASILYDNVEYKKLSHHTGERRWVGQSSPGNYLLLFYDSINDEKIRMSLSAMKDLEALYQVKHDEKTYREYLVIPNS